MTSLQRYRLLKDSPLVWFGRREPSSEAQPTKDAPPQSRGIQPYMVIGSIVNHIWSLSLIRAVDSVESISDALLKGWKSDEWL